MIVLKSIMTDDMIEKESNGEVTNLKFFNFDKVRPEPFDDGLFCQKVFGTLVDYTCKCGITKPKSDSVCPTCGVKYEKRSERRNNFGHIDFSGIMYINPLIVVPFFKIFGINKIDANDITYNSKQFSFIESNSGYLEDFSGKTYQLTTMSGDKNSIQSLYNGLKELNIDPVKTLKNCGSGFSLKCLSENINLFDLFNSKILVMPPAMRDISLHENKVFYDSKNSLYLKLLRISIRSKTSKSLNIEAVKKLSDSKDSINIQKIISNLFIGDNISEYDLTSETISPILSSITSKNGLIRGNILGKRVDYSGRSLIIPDPTLPLDTINMPEYMAFALLEPFIISELIKYYMIIENSPKITLSSYNKARNEYKRSTNLAYNVMRRISKNHRVLLNRAPTLHRYGIQGFKFFTYNGNSIKINNLICTPFNADFDGDQVALHLALSKSARDELDNLMSVVKNLLSCKDYNELNIKPSHESVVGAYLLGA